MIIYVCINKVNNFKYVGCTIKDLDIRKSTHYYAAFSQKKKNYFYRALRKYGWDNFEWKILDFATTHQELLEKEKKYIEELKTFKNNGYNETCGGRGCVGWKHSKETKKKISEKSKGRSHKQSEETKKKLSKHFKGKTYQELYGKEKAEKVLKIKKLNYIDRYGEEKSNSIKLKQSLNSKSNTIEVKEKKEKKYLLRLDKNGKRIDLTEQGRINISNSKTGEKNPNYVNIDLNIQNEIITNYKQNNFKITKKMVNDFKISNYLIERVLKQNNEYVKKRTQTNTDLEK